ncbi:DnaB-like helicase C-terminal domain-containing protein [Pseudodesulfovibrio sediminis]|uniref:SF4 helicase domain-containing protein n=1 Tax=Pseudodesulfovibrio sediminis TaxID=2810563 RepID=A0ABN6ELE4_9BACT|nr:DnaB-like helicase C-terminal domain-containing protein [Pseudodesulfovibrio sediminis]BCS86837.1 hypothetical protein PSDVSF_00790 [Pseudodesulfovibrio sediminis]
MPHEDAKRLGLMELTERARRWVTDQPPGEFSAFIFGKELHLGENPEIRDTVLRDLVIMGSIEPCGKKRGQYRAVQNECREMDWHNAETEYYPIWLPLELHTLAGVQRKNVVIVAGETNAGKTAFVMELIYRNLQVNGGAHSEIRLYNSEMGDGELRQRVMNLDNNVQSWDGFRPFERTSNFHQVIDPDGFNVIDYLEVSNEFYLVANWIQKIHAKLNKGIAIICIQKPKGKDTARGGEFSLEKSRLAISLFQNHGVHSCKIVKCKLPMGITNPQGMERDFYVERGRKIVSRSDWRYLTQKERDQLWTLYETDAAAKNARKELGL